jgi:hypothetical protein
MFIEIGIIVEKVKDGFTLRRVSWGVPAPQNAMMLNYARAIEPLGDVTEIGLKAAAIRQNVLALPANEGEISVFSVAYGNMANQTLVTPVLRSASDDHTTVQERVAVNATEADLDVHNLIVEAL